MRTSGRRLSVRNRLAHPVEAVLTLCRPEEIRGWIVNEQDEGVGMAFGGADVATVEAHVACCLEGEASLWIGDAGDEENRPIPMRLAHVTSAEPRKCIAGLSFDVQRMKPEDIVHLLGVWRRFVVEARKPVQS